ncbi:uncharacterized protein LOC128886508 isoform X2 [Hylaeus anthracinus]|uniref:uncharacterized protein LOC128886508 isoform X2 n=1 Tax=Hylaeus anthracinus TaxID=313031 RepID=UPI0023B8E81A|nr:uncharacterized protein LOC128886508 isoform X2 [Hylaeus anthracinus]
MNVLCKEYIRFYVQNMICYKIKNINANAFSGNVPLIIIVTSCYKKRLHKHSLYAASDYPVSNSNARRIAVEMAMDSDTVQRNVINCKRKRAAGLALPLLYSLHVHRNDPIIFTKAACLCVAVTQIPVHSSFCLAHHERLQGLLEQMTDYCAKAKSYERFVLQRYVNKYSTFYGVSATWFYVTAAIFVVGTLFVDQPFPTEAEYPFNVDYEPLRTTLFLHQTVVGFQCAANVCVNGFAAMLLLFAAARFEIIMIELRAVQDIQMLVECIQKYYHVKRYAQEVVTFAQYIALTATIVASFLLVLCGFHIVGRQPLAIKLQFLFLAMTALMEVFMCAWPADNLLDVSEGAIRSLYEVDWYDQDLNMQRTVMQTLVPQKPIAISIACVIPVMSLNYYCSYVANAFSIFTALRVMLSDEDESLLPRTNNTILTTD